MLCSPDRQDGSCSRLLSSYDTRRGPEPGAKLTVAAANLTGVLGEVGRAFKAKTARRSRTSSQQDIPTPAVAQVHGEIENDGDGDIGPVPAVALQSGT